MAEKRKDDCLNMKKTALTIVLVLLLAFIAFYAYIKFAVGGPVARPPANYTPGYAFSISETGVVDNGQDGQRSLYVIYHIGGKDVSAANVSAKMYRSEIPTDVYLLDYICDSCGTISDFKAALEQQLKADGIIPSESTLVSKKFNQLEQLDTKAIIIIPTGRIPSLLFDANSSANLNRLMERGCVVIYIGGDFAQWMARSGVVEAVPPNALSPYSLMQISSEVGRADPPYTFEGGSYRLGGNSSTYKSAISVQTIANGYFVAFPNALDQGWNSRGGGNGTAAAKDVARFISEVGWQYPVADGNRSLRADTGGVINATDTLIISPTDRNSGYLRLYMNISGPNNSTSNASAPKTWTTREYRDLRIGNTITGRLVNPNFQVNGSIMDMKLELHENFSEPREIELFIVTTKDGEVLSQQSLGPPVSFVTDYTTEKHYAVNLTGGEYILRITDVSGKTYAHSLLHVPLVIAELSGKPNWAAPAIAFSLTSDGRPVEDMEVAISMDNGPRAVLKTDRSGKFTYSPADKPGYGDHVFRINSTGRSFTVKASYVRQTTFFDDPMNQGILVATILVLVVGLALRRAEPAKYFIDVPDFPPQQKERIPISRFALINLMEGIDREYRWKWMPLTAQEIKAGVRKRLNYQGKPILVSDYNLEKLLGQLIGSGEATRALGLYGLASWEKQSGKSAQYLAMFRMLRNFLISHAVLFTDVGQRQECDILMNYRGESIYIHIYEGDETVKRALLSAKKGKNFIVFESREQLQGFVRQLGPAATRLAVALKMEMGSRQVMLAHVESLGPIIGMADLR